MKIELESGELAEIYDSREYCGNPFGESCDQLSYKRGNPYFPVCRGFGENLGHCMSGEYDEFHEEIEVPVKCKKCKEAYAKAKENEEICFNITLSE